MQSDYAADLLYIITIYLTKASAVFLFLRLTPNKAHKLFCWTIMGTSTLWVILSIFIVALRCQLSQPWVVNEHCVNVVSFPTVAHHFPPPPPSTNAEEKVSPMADYWSPGRCDRIGSFRNGRISCSRFTNESPA